MKIDYSFVENNLNFVLRELKGQPEIASRFPDDIQSYEEHLAQLDEWLHDAGEYGLAFQCMVSMLENIPFQLSGSSAIKLLEVALIFGFKTDSDKDKCFDRRVDEIRVR